MATYRVNSGNCAHWAPATAYGLGVRVMAKASNTTAARRKLVYECTTAGTSHTTTEPAWPTVGNTVNDNGVIWTARAATSWADAHGSYVMLADNLSLGNGDTVLVHNTHNENIGSTDGSVVFDAGGSVAAPNYVICVDKDNSDVLSSGAVINFGVFKRYYGTPYAYFINCKLVFSYAAKCLDLETGSVLILIGIGSNLTLLHLSGADGYINTPISSSINAQFFIYNGNIQFDYAANYIVPTLIFQWKGGSFIGANGATYLFNLGPLQYINSRITISDVDLSAVGAGTLFNVTTTAKQVNATLTRCKLPTNLSAINNAWPNTWDVGSIKLHGCSYAEKTHGFTESSNQGVVSEEISIVRTGGATDGITPIAWKMVSSSRALSPFPRLESPTINLWNASTSPITLTVHGIVDSATNLKDCDVWMEVEYPADTTSGLGTIVSTLKIAVCETEADLTASTETWAESMGNPNKFKLAATFTPAQAGPIAARVCVGKASTTVYICPKAVIS